PPAPETIVQMDPRPAMHQQSNRTTQVQEEFLVALWNILVIIADLHIDLGPAPDSSNGKINSNHTHKPLDVVSLLTSEDTAPETVAPRSIDNEKE
ncbi:hypothetical protein, partial [uncultured Roseobacter sp.]|uniref:hypothetical protein n=1 Tax=uncultured Roseobacter sp. TaxID=114847 RepID=UPI00260A2EC6